MYYLYKKSKDNALPEFKYVFKKVEDFYNVVEVLTIPIVGNYFIQIKTEKYDEVVRIINDSENFKHLIIYIELSETLLDYVRLYIPNVNILDSKSNFEVFKELIQKYEILFDKDCISILYSAVNHTYADMDEALELVKRSYGKNLVTKEMISKLFIVDDLVYPRRVCIAYLFMYRGRNGLLKKCIEQFGNDLTMYAIRKTSRLLIKEKIKYLKTGKGNNLIKKINTLNLVKLCNAIDYSRNGFKDITTILNLYEKGMNVNDIIQERANTFTDEEYYSIR